MGQSEGISSPGRGFQDSALGNRGLAACKTLGIPRGSKLSNGSNCSHTKSLYQRTTLELTLEPSAEPGYFPNLV